MSQRNVITITGIKGRRSEFSTQGKNLNKVKIMLRIININKSKK